MKLADFESGIWQIDRTISDKTTNQVSTFVGTATIKNGVYHEVGDMRLSEGTILTAERKYLWAQGEGCIEIRFEDGRPFHKMEVEGKSKADHWCDPDRYDVEYDFSEPHEWVAVWTVSGPRKNYVMTSRYRKQ